MSIYTINKKFRAVPDAPAREAPSEARLAVAEMFGIGLDEAQEVALYENLTLDVREGDLVFITGPSGSGKSVLLRCLVEAIRASDPSARIVDLAEAVAPPGVAVVEGLVAVQSPTRLRQGFGGQGSKVQGQTARQTAVADPATAKPGADGGIGAALRLASTAGLADAFVLLRPPEELSDGQRWRLRLAHALKALRNTGYGIRKERPNSKNGAAREGRPAPEPMRVLVADELASTLDRLCARAVAYRLRRLADREGVTILAASAHDDLVEDLAPDVLVVKDAGARVEVRYADAARGKGRAR